MLDKVEKHLGPPSVRDGIISLDVKTGQIIKSRRIINEPTSPPNPQ